MNIKRVRSIKGSVVRSKRRREMQNLFKPGFIGKLKIKNRIVMAPMGTTGLVEPDGRYSQRGIDYFVARAKGGVGLIETGLMVVDVEIEKRALGPWSAYPRADSPVYIARLNELADAIHEYGARITAQLTAGLGRVARGAIVNSGWAIAPSPQPCFWNPNIAARGLTTEEIEKLVKALSAAATIIKMAGFDAIELHGHEGYLLDQFMTSKWNKRTDKYGGDLEGRLRFPLEVIESIRKAVGPDFPIIFRMAAIHYVEGGREIDESIVIAKRFQEAGIDCLHVDAGCYESWNWAHPPLYMEPAPVIESIASIKNAVSVPIIAVGRLGYPDLAEKILAKGKADFIALGRQLLADPEWPNKVKEERWDDIRPCIGDHDGCMGRIFEGKYISCTVNPQTGMEREFNIQPALEKKSVLVIGGGPGGMEAARVAALRGHKVTLWEKSGELGGNLISASVPEFKSDIKNLLRFLSSQIKKLGVQIVLNKEATTALIKNANAEVVIMATGAMPITPEIPGNGRNQIITAIDLLLGKKEAGKKVVVIGGGFIGCEVALWLAQRGKTVAILEALEDVMVDTFLANKKQMLQMLTKANVTIMTGVKGWEATDRGIIVENLEGKEVIEADTIAIAVGLKPETSLIDSLKGALPSIHAIGDCIEPRKIQSAIWEAFRVALRI
jgi:2-enoate reductase